MLKKVFTFYIEGFKGSLASPTGKYLWAIILIKLFIMLFILKLFFFPDMINKSFRTDKEKSSHVIEVLTRSK